MVLEQVGIVRSLWLKILLSFCIKFCENTNECVPIWWYGVSAPREKTYHKVTRWYAPSFSIFGRFYANCATGLSLLLKNQSLCLKLAAAALSQTHFFFFKLDKPLRDKTPQNLWNYSPPKKVYMPLNFAPPAFWAKYIAIFSSHKISLYSIYLQVVESKFQNIDRK